MITRIHGATSTLAANPRKKHHKRRNPRRHGHARRRRNPEDAPKKAKRAFGAAKLDKIARLEKTIADLRAAISAGPKKRPKKGEPGYVARAYKPSEKVLAARRARAALKAELDQFKEIHGYKRPKSHEGTLVGYAYPFTRTNKKGREVYAGMNIMQGFKVKQKPRASLYRTRTGYKLFKNPLGGLVVAGVPVIDMAIGSAAAIAIGATAKGLIDNVKALEAIKTSPVGDIAGELVTAAAAFVLHDKVLKNPMHKSIAQYAFIGAVFQILSKKLTSPIEGLVKKIPGVAPAAGATAGYSSAMSGVYFDPYTAAPAVGGYVSAETGALSGMYTDVNAMGGLFSAPSIYG